MRLKRIDIQLQNYGPNKGKYEGMIVFEDGQTDSFTFGLNPETCAKYIEPIAHQIISSSRELGEKLAQSFTRELEPPKQ